jgi:hypothetical protein
MLTPAISASSTSVPPVSAANAVSTQVLVPPFLKKLPFAEAMTSGFAVRVFTAGAAWPLAVEGTAAAATPAAPVFLTNSRRERRVGIRRG